MNKERIVILVLLGVILILWLFRGCGSPKPIKGIGLKTELARQATIRTVIKYKNSIQVKEVVKWKTFKDNQDTASPCYTEVKYVIQKADTVIRADSSLIVSLKSLILVDSIIQLKQNSVIVQKSDSIRVLKRKLKWSHLKTKGVIALWILREGVGVAQRVRD